jgi:O-antigen/teichoic acid export membrane protein
MKSKLFSNTLIYGLSGSFVASIPFLLMPFMTRNMSQEHYGLAIFFSSLLSLILPIIGFGSSNSLAVRFFQLEKKIFSSYLWSCIFLSVFSSLTILVFFLFFSERILGFSAITFDWFLLAILATSFWGISQACGTYLIAKSDAIYYLFINFLIGFLTVSLTIILIIFYDLSWKGFAIALFFAHFFASVFSIVKFINDQKFSKIQPDFLKDSLKFGVPVMFHSLSMGLISFSDRFIISNYLGLDFLGKYSVAFQLGIILSFIAQAFNKAFVPWLYEKLRDESINSKLKVVQGTYLIFLVIILSTILFISILDHLILFFAGRDYAGVYEIAVIIAIGGAFNAAYLMIVNYIFYANKTFQLGFMSLLVSFIFIFLSFFLTPTFGLRGAAFSYALANIILFLSVWALAIKSYSMPWISKEIFKKIY